MNVNQNIMNASLSEMLMPDEAITCAVFCAYSQTGFLARSENIMTGFAACTDKQRFLTIKTGISGNESKALSITAVKNLKIKRNIFGQYKIDALFADIPKDIHIKLQIAPDIVGGGFPAQKQELEKMLITLKQYEI